MMLGQLAARGVNKPVLCVSALRTALPRGALCAYSSVSDAPRPDHAVFRRIATRMGSLFKKNYDENEIEQLVRPATQYLQSLGLTPKQALTCVAMHPMIVKYTPDAMNRKVSWLRQNGMTPNLLVSAVRRAPNVLGVSEESLEAMRQWYLNMGIPQEKIGFLFSTFPHGPSMSIEGNLEKKKLVLQSMGLDDDQIRRMVQRVPQSFTISIDNMLEKAEKMKVWGVPEQQVPKILAIVPELLALNADRVHAKLVMLDSLFGEGVGVNFFIRCPRIIMYSLKTLRSSHEFLTQEAGISSDRIQENPNILMRSVDHILRPRFEFLQTQEHEKDVPITRWIHASDVNFTKEFPEYAEFRAKMRST
ncbi:hypothetical protein Poli38472_008823 [Pythium oligandrum]|uniref:Mitochondrial transcription termination factor n=1 Tax=Pythium oligandrum TaxID=41045 RepID=A0A8K1FAE6_PYTOL|nr:hypothetical protein Poli38472_008823 [Pythium oligandrum]|eukprot:TMW56175.1 hypothetical protein Poli38472_008823 [Pythium oligandrum]